MSTPRRHRSDADRGLTRHEEELRIGRVLAPLGNVHVEKRVETRRVEQDVPRTVEQPAVERMPVEEGDSGQIETLPDGSVSIPVLEEELVITKRLVVRERIVVRKEVATQHERVAAELRREHVDVDVEDAS